MTLKKNKVLNLAIVITLALSLQLFCLILVNKIYATDELIKLNKFLEDNNDLLSSLFKESKYLQYILKIREMLNEVYDIDLNEDEYNYEGINDNDYEKIISASDNIILLIDRNKEKIIPKRTFTTPREKQIDDMVIEGTKLFFKRISAECYEKLGEYNTALSIYEKIILYYKELLKNAQEPIVDYSKALEEAVIILTEEQREKINEEIIELENRIAIIKEQQAE